ncbi:unnamed protein product, partial [Gulo gulo]
RRERPRPQAGLAGTAVKISLPARARQLAGPAGGNAADPSSPPVRLIQGLLLLLRGEGGGVWEGGDEGGIRTNISDWCKDKYGHDVNDSHPSLSAERRSSGQPGLCPQLWWLSPGSGGLSAR